MLENRLAQTIVLVLLIAVSAVLADFGQFIIVHHTFAGYDPSSAAEVALVVGAPIAWVMVGQWVKMRRSQEALTALVGEKDAMVIKAEQALEKSRESQALYRLIAENQFDVISLWDVEGNRIYTSPSAERAFGSTPEERIAALARDRFADMIIHSGLQTFLHMLRQHVGAKRKYGCRTVQLRTRPDGLRRR